MNEVSPFLNREAREVYRAEAQTYAERLIPSPEAQRGKIETFRYRRYARTGSLSSFMQRLGDWGRKYFPFIGRGWDGFGPNR